MRIACMLVIGLLAGLIAGGYVQSEVRTLALLFGLAFLAVAVWTMTDRREDESCKD